MEETITIKESWEKWTHEHPEAYSCFLIYRDSPSLSWDEIASLTPFSAPDIASWANEFQWVERAQAYYAHIEIVLTPSTTLSDHDKRIADRLASYQIARDKAVAALTDIDPLILANNPNAIVKLLEFADHGERMEYGEATQRSQNNNVNVTISNESVLAAARAMGLLGEKRP